MKATSNDIIKHTVKEVFNMIVKTRRGTDSASPYFTNAWGWLHPPRQTEDVCEWIVEPGNAAFPSTVQMVEGDDDIMLTTWDHAISQEREIYQICRELQTDNPIVRRNVGIIYASAVASVWLKRSEAVAKHYGLSFAPPLFGKHYADPVQATRDAIAAERKAYRRVR